MQQVKQWSFISILSGSSTSFNLEQCSKQQYGIVVIVTLGEKGCLIVGNENIQIDSIKKQTLGGSSGSSSPSAAGIGAVTSAPVRRDVNGASITQALNQQHSTRVYVLESDITNTQKKVDVQESENVF